MTDDEDLCLSHHVVYYLLSHDYGRSSRPARISSVATTVILVVQKLLAIDSFVIFGLLSNVIQLFVLKLVDVQNLLLSLHIRKVDTYDEVLQPLSQEDLVFAFSVESFPSLFDIIVAAIDPLKEDQRLEILLELCQKNVAIEAEAEEVCQFSLGTFS